MKTYKSVYLLIFFTLYPYYIHAANEGLTKAVFMGILSAIVIVVASYYHDLRRSGKLSKKGRVINKFEKDERKFDLDIGELKALHKKGILTIEELNTKMNNIKEEKRFFLLEHYLEENKKYKAIIDARSKGFITENEKNIKVNDLRKQVERDISNREKNKRYQY